MTDDISKLIREAKPLYFERKRRNNRIKASLAMIMFVVLINGFYPRNEIYVDNFDYYLIDDGVEVSENVSIIEEMGLPTDDYGLLMVG